MHLKMKRLIISYDQLDANIFENLDETSTVSEKSIQKEIQNPNFFLVIE